MHICARRASISILFFFSAESIRLNRVFFILNWKFTPLSGKKKSWRRIICQTGRSERIINRIIKKVCLNTTTTTTTTTTPNTTIIKQDVS